jgi:hypothetical protein
MRFPARSLFLLAFSLTAPAFQADGTLRIDSPAAGETISGTVEITGTAAAPGMMRWRAEFAYDPDPTGTWFLISEGVDPVENGLLAEWDTSRIREGDYALRIAAYFADGSMRQTVLRGIRVRPGLTPTAVPTEEAVTPVGVDPEVHPPAAAAFPAHTAAASESRAASRPNSSPAAPFLAGVILAFLGYGLAALRRQWRWWKHSRFVRNLRKNG